VKRTSSASGNDFHQFIRGPEMKSMITFFLPIMMMMTPVRSDYLFLHEVDASEQSTSIEYMHESLVSDKLQRYSLVTGKASDLEQRMRALIIPSIEFRNASLADVLDFLARTGIEADPEQKRIRLVHYRFLPDSFKEPAGDMNAVPADEAETVAVAATTHEQPSEKAKISINLKTISWYDAMKYVCEVADLGFRITEDAVIVFPRENRPR